jgi:hypothetical protein
LGQQKVFVACCRITKKRKVSVHRFRVSGNKLFLQMSVNTLHRIEGVGHIPIQIRLALTPHLEVESFHGQFTCRRIGGHRTFVWTGLPSPPKDRGRRRRRVGARAGAGGVGGAHYPRVEGLQTRAREPNPVPVPATRHGQEVVPAPATRGHTHACQTITSI